VIREVPAETPQTTPVSDPIVATDVLELVQTPPDTVLLSVLHEPAQILVGPVIAVGADVTLIVVVT
jgi:hypothetical protein